MSINLSQSILHDQFPRIAGLELTELGLRRLFSVQAGSFIQILFGDAHWITISGDSFNEVVSVYDSLNHGYVKRAFFHQITDIRKVASAEVLVEVKSVQQQNNSVDCGVFAIAFAVDLAFNNDPTTCSYDQSLMRKHLISCLESGLFQPFPKLENKRSRKCRATKVVRNVYCICRRTYFDQDSDDDPRNFMAPCSVCKEWFHKSCSNIPVRVFRDDSIAKNWKCKSCS